jgi:hypothetical protein
MALTLLELFGPISAEDAAIAWACKCATFGREGVPESHRRPFAELLRASGLCLPSVEADAARLRRW